MKLSNEIKSVSLAMTLGMMMVAGVAIAQERVLDRSIRSEDAPVQSARPSSIFAVMTTTPNVASDGLQFRIAYDPTQVKVSNTADCLIGLPKQLRGSLVSCKDIQQLNFVQVAILDLSGKKAIPAGLELGFVEFESIADKGTDATGPAYWVEDVHVSGAASKAPRESFNVSLGQIDY
mgnify:CR=1 FL=1